MLQVIERREVKRLQTLTESYKMENEIKVPQPLHVPAFGEAAMAMDITLQITIDLLIRENREFGQNLAGAIDRVLELSGPTPGVRIALNAVRERVDLVLAREHN